MPTLKEFRKILRKGIGNTTPNDLKESEYVATMPPFPLPMEPKDMMSGSMFSFSKENRSKVLAMLKSSGSLDLGKISDMRRTTSEKSLEHYPPPRWTLKAISGEVVLLSGKHADNTLREIMKVDPGYLNWICSYYKDDKSNDNEISTLISHIKYEIGKIV